MNVLIAVVFFFTAAASACDPGFWFNDTTAECHLCPPGTYMPRASVFWRCGQCEAQHYSGWGATSCSDCGGIRETSADQSSCDVTLAFIIGMAVFGPVCLFIAAWCVWKIRKERKAKSTPPPAPVAASASAVQLVVSADSEGSAQTPAPLTE